MWFLFSRAVHRSNLTEKRIAAENKIVNCYRNPSLFSGPPQPALSLLSVSLALMPLSSTISPAAEISTRTAAWSSRYSITVE